MTAQTIRQAQRIFPSAAPARRADKLLAAAREETGSQLIEMAVGLSVMLLATFGLISFACILYGTNNVAFASKLAIRYASLHSSATTSPATKAQLDTYLTPFQPRYPANTLSTALTYTSGNVVGSTVTYTTTITYSIKLPGYTLNNVKLVTASSAVVTQ